MHANLLFYQEEELHHVEQNLHFQTTTLLMKLVLCSQGIQFLGAVSLKPKSCCKLAEVIIAVTLLRKPHVATQVYGPAVQ